MKDSDRSNKLLNDRKDSLHNILDQLPHRKFSKRKVGVTAVGSRGAVARSLNDSIGNECLLNSKDELLPGSTSLMMIGSAFLRLIEGEYRLMKSIIPTEHQELILDKLVDKSLLNFLTEYETVYSRAKNSLTSKKEFLVVIPLFRMIKHMNALLPGYQAILEKSLAKSHTRIQSLNIRCGELAIRFLEEFIGEISSQPCKITAVPKDGTVHEMTSQTMSFMEQLLEHVGTAGPLWAAKDSSLARIQEPELLATKGMASCQHRILSTLTMKLEGKATCYENMCLRNIFLLNNYHFIRKTLTRSPTMIPLLEQEMADLEDKFNELIGKQRKGYTVYAFAKLTTHIEDSVPVPEGTEKLNTPLKQSIKDRFKGFNNEIDEIVRVQRSFSIPDPYLRESLRTENNNLVYPLYSEFYSAYYKAPFTKNPEKYLKYNPDEVSDMLMSLFDSTS
ncbi:Exocyst complex component 7-like [Oopsacas minuta]|uniref:Exocyst complex component 7 n=1 Tax=Oopsacas minuta TaxID=111878 RepID=A0AAV7KJ87_9METZ|nr:Exocyst complex component 7-like [Oopsacas minuta]